MSNIFTLQVIWALNIGAKGVNRDDLEAEFKAAGLRVPRRPSAEALLTRATSRVRVGRDWLGVKRIGKGIGFVRYDIEPGGKLFNPVHIATAATVKLPDGETGVGVEFNPSIPVTQGMELLADDILEGFRQAKDYATAEDVRIILQEAVRGTRRRPGMAGVPVVGNGVQAYFVPAGFRTEAQALKTILGRLSPASRCNVYGLSAEGNLEQVAGVVRDSSLNDLASTMNDITALVAEKGNANSLAARVDAVRNLKAKAQLWSEVLGAMGGDMLMKVSAAETQIKTELGL